LIENFVFSSYSGEKDLARHSIQNLIVTRNRPTAIFNLFMTSELVIIYATQWCWDCRRARRFFDRNNIAYRWIDIDHDAAGEQFVLETNKGFRSVPTIVLSNGIILVEPNDQQLASQFTG